MGKDGIRAMHKETQIEKRPREINAGPGTGQELAPLERSQRCADQSGANKFSIQALFTLVMSAPHDKKTQ